MQLPNDIVQFLQQYDLALKVLGAIAAPGGIWFWIDKYRNRIQIKVRNFGFVRGDQSMRGVAFELENIGSTNTSLEPNFFVTAYSPERIRQTGTFRIDGNDRRLPPHEPKQIQGWHNDSESRVVAFAWYMAFTIPLTRGRNVRVLLRNAQFHQLGWLRFHWERMLFKAFGKVPE